MNYINSDSQRYCKGCVYFARGYVRFCDYIGKTGMRRPCPPGKDCTVKLTHSQRARLIARRGILREGG